MLPDRMPGLATARAVVCAALALVVDLALLLAGASLLVRDRSREGAMMQVGPGPVVLSTLVTLA